MWIRGTVYMEVKHFNISRTKFPIQIKDFVHCRNGIALFFDSRRERDDYVIKMMLNASNFIKSMTIYQTEIILESDYPISILRCESDVESDYPKIIGGDGNDTETNVS